MSTHRIRLTDEDMVIIGAALRARLAMRRGPKRIATRRLMDRLAECTPGNPAWILGWDAPANTPQALDKATNP